MFGLDDWIAGLSNGGSIAVVVAVAVLLGLRHATDPDHIAAVTTLVASGRERATGAAARLGAWWGAGHALTLVVFGIPILLADRYLPDALQRGAETAVAALIVFLAVRLIVRWKSRRLRVALHARRESSAPRALAGRSVRDRARPRHGWQRRRRRPAARRDPVSPTWSLSLLVVLAFFTAVSMTIVTTGFGALLSAPVLSRRDDRAAPRSAPRASLSASGTPPQRGAWRPIRSERSGRVGVCPPRRHTPVHAGGGDGAGA